MRPARVITLALVILWGLFVPIAMASGLCAMMGVSCEGPCGASLAPSVPTAPTATGLVTSTFLTSQPAAPSLEQAVPEPPPRSLLSAA
jgi:hypothetical protein